MNFRAAKKTAFGASSSIRITRTPFGEWPNCSGQANNNVPYRENGAERASHPGDCEMGTQ